MQEFYPALVSFMLNSIWITGLAWGFYLLSVRHNPSPGRQHNLALAFLGSGLLMSLAAFIPGFRLTDIVSANFSSTHNTLWQSWIGGTYLTGLILHLLVLGWRLQNLNRLGQSLSIPGTWQQDCNKWAAEFGISKNVILKTTRKTFSPATYGFLKPVILVPAACFTQLNAKELEFLIRHELAHIRRNDYLIQLFLEIIRGLFFFNPFVYLFIRSIKATSEKAADDLVVGMGAAPVFYAQTLVKLAEFNLAPAIAVAAAGKKNSVFKERIYRLVQQRPPATAFPFRKVALGVAAMGLAAMMSAHFNARSPETALVSHLSQVVYTTPSGLGIEMAPPALSFEETEPLLPAPADLDESTDITEPVFKQELEQPELVDENAAIAPPIVLVAAPDAEQAARKAAIEIADEWQAAQREKWLEDVEDLAVEANEWKAVLEEVEFQKFQAQLKADLGNELTLSMLNQLRWQQTLDSALMLTAEEYQEMERTAAALRKLKTERPEFFKQVQKTIPNSRIYLLEMDSLPRVRVVVSL